jgi:hypothetical protein
MFGKFKTLINSKELVGTFLKKRKEKKNKKNKK